MLTPTLEKNHGSAAIALVGIAMLLIVLVFSGCAAPEDSDKVSFSTQPGSYMQDELGVELSAARGMEIHYTLDGSAPTAESPVYDGPITLHDRTSEPDVLFSPENVAQMGYGDQPVYNDPPFPKANIIRAAAFAPDGSCGPVATGTYFVGIDLAATYPGTPVVSIVCDPVDLLDYDTGIMVLGRIFDEWRTSDEAKQVIAGEKWKELQTNYNQKGKEWERPASYELFSDGKPTLAFDAGIRLKGGYSRFFLQRSFNVYLRESYGQESLDYPLIPTAVDAEGETIQHYSRFALRNGGNDVEFLKFRDPFLQSLVADRNFETQASVPVMVFLNGEFMSVYSLQVRYTEDYFAQRYGVDPDEVVVVKEGEIEAGEDDDLALYEDFLAFGEADLSDPAEWKRFEQAVDVDSMLDYFATEIYIGNSDFKPDGNSELWRTRDTDDANPHADGRWRFCIFDLEQSSGLYENKSALRSDYDSFALAVGRFPVFAAALKNPEFAQRFVERIDEMGRTDFAPEHVSSQLEAWATQWKPSVDSYRARFGGLSEYWDYYLTNLEGYFAERHDLILAHVKADLSL